MVPLPWATACDILCPVFPFLGPKRPLSLWQLMGYLEGIPARPSSPVKKPCDVYAQASPLRSEAGGIGRLLTAELN
jgi:hypothetical protein